MGALWRDVRFSLRGIKNRPAFAALIVIMMALSIGANSALFSVLSAVLLRSMPYKDAERLVMVWETNLQKNLPESVFSVPKFKAIKDQNHHFDDMAAMMFANFNLTGDKEPEQIRGAKVSGSLTRVLGVNVARGRDFLPEEDQPGGDPVVILSDSLWQRRFAGDPAILDQSLMLDGKSYKVIGIMPPGFTFYNENVRLWVPRAFENSLLTQKQIDAGAGSLFVVARLKQGSDVRAAEADVTTINERYRQAYPANTDAENGIRIVPLREQLVRDIRTTLLVMWGTVGLVLLIACANIASLLLARATSRFKEVAIRTAIGATRRRIIRQLLTESLILSLLGGLLGLALAYAGIKIILAINPDSLPHFNEISISAGVFAFTLGIACLAGILFGLTPALLLSKTNLNELLKDSAKGSSGGGFRNRVLSVLVVSEIALALMLSIGAGLMIKSFKRLQAVNPGFDANNVLTMRITLARSRYPEKRQQQAFYEQVLERVKSVPGIQSFGAISYLPLGGGGIQHFYKIEGIERPDLGKDPLVSTYVVSPDYFKTMNIKLLQGQAFTEHDDSTSQKVVIISQTLSRKYFNNDSPIGRRLAINADYSPAGWMTIVGVADDVRISDLSEEAGDTLYVPYKQQPWPNMYLVVRADNPTSLTDAVRSQVLAVDKDQPISSIRTMAEVVETSVALSRFVMVLLSTFAGLALVLAVLGIYSVMAYSVTERASEIGIRMALGAQQQDVVKLFLSRGLILTLLAVMIGVGGAIAATRVIATLLYSVNATDPVTFLSLSLMIIIVALLACYIPARRATKVDPVKVLWH